MQNNFDLALFGQNFLSEFRLNPFVEKSIQCDDNYDDRQGGKDCECGNQIGRKSFFISEFEDIIQNCGLF